MNLQPLLIQRDLDLIRTVVGLTNTGHIELAVLELHQYSNKLDLIDRIKQQLDTDLATQFEELFKDLSC
jgi:hypothetical protein